MSAITLLIIETIMCFLMLIIMYKKYKTEGLYLYTIILIFLSSLMSLKTIPFYNYDMNLGIIPFVTIFTNFNIIIQKKGVEETKRLLLTVLSATIVSYILLLLLSYMNSSDINLFTSASYDNIFKNSIRIYFAVIVSLLYSLLLNNKLYFYLKMMKNNILISNIFSGIIIQFIASTIFGLVAYTFELDLIDIVKIIMIRYLMSLIISVISTLLVYITKYIKEES